MLPAGNIRLHRLLKGIQKWRTIGPRIPDRNGKRRVRALKTGRMRTSVFPRKATVERLPGPEETVAVTPMFPLGRMA